MNQQHPYYVLEIHYVGRPPQTQSFNASRVVVGRDGGDIVLGDTEASAMHAELEFQNGQLVVRDLGSSNGTWKDGRAMPQFAMSAGQSFTCGKTVIKVVQLVGGQQLQAGGTVMGDANVLAELKQQQAAMAGGAAASAPKKSGAGLAIGLIAGVAVLGGGGFAAYQLLGADDDEPVAQADPSPEPEPKLDVPPEPKLDVPVPVETKDPEEDEPVVEKDMGELYRQVGAATVVIRVPGSVGSGSIIDPKGIILTNHHVIDGGERDGLRIKANVTLGTFSEEMQAFEPQEKTLEAYVLEVDIDHDLALIQLIEPPADLPSLKLSAKAPYPGQRVAAVGHAGAGLLWALKGGEVSSTGKLAGHTDLALEQAEGAQKEYLAKIKAQMDKQGRVVQSTAKILPGDSGGPLVSTAGEIVGVNAFVRNDRSTGQWLSFHVHLAEVEALVKEIPDDPLDFIPDPWDMKDVSVQGGDVDLDGRVETLVVSTPGLGGKLAYFLDLDQSSLGKGESPPAWPELANEDERPFDAELVVINEGGNRNVWYDTDDDGHFDVYMLGTGGTVTDAYKVPKEGPATKDSSLLVDDGLDAKLFEDSDVKKRFGRVGPVVFPGAVEPVGGGLAMPDPKGAGQSFLPVDQDGDGTTDTFIENTFFHRRYMFDLDQDAGISSGYAMSSRVGSADVEVVVIEQGSSIWVWYDTDGDKSLETVLQTSIPAAAGATKAWVDGSPNTTQLGRALLRQDLLADDDAKARFKTALEKSISGRVVTSGLGIDGFPPLRVGPRASVVIRDAAGLTNAVATVTEYSHDLVLLDLDGDTAAAGTNHAEFAKLTRAGKFDAEFAMLTVGDVRWAYYDTDGKNGFDTVFVASKPKDRTPTAAYRIKKGGAVEPIEAGESLVRFGPFKKKLKKKFKKAAPTLFPGQLTE